jgi:WD40 repeat protein
MSPDGEAIVTGAGDETLRFWNVFSKARSQKVCCLTYSLEEKRMSCNVHIF